MPFRNPIRRLSQLVADTVTGALLRTGEPPVVRIEIGANTNPDALADDTIRFYTTNPNEIKPGHIIPFDTGPISGLKLVGADDGGTPAEVSVTDNYLGLDGGSDGFGIIDLFSASVVRFRSPARFSPSGTGGRLLNALDWGSATLVTNASGEDTVAHDLGQDPDAILITGALAGTQLMKFRVTAHGVNNFTVEVRNSGTNALPAAGTNATIFWLAIG